MLNKQEQKLLALLRRGERKSCQLFVQQYLPSLFAFFRGMGEPKEIAEDLAQETFLEFWKSLSSFRGESSLKTWIFLLGRRVAWKQRKKRPRQEFSSETEEHHQTEGHEALQDELLWKQEQHSVLTQSMQTLDERFKEVLLLHYMEELTIKEVALVLDLKEGTVKSRIHRGIHHLKKQLDSHWQ